jgi:hypothetical protein
LYRRVVHRTAEPPRALDSAKSTTDTIKAAADSSKDSTAAAKDSLTKP